MVLLVRTVRILAHFFTICARNPEFTAQHGSLDPPRTYLSFLSLGNSHPCTEKNIIVKSLAAIQIINLDGINLTKSTNIVQCKLFNVMVST